jgi:hypothetical protein
MNHVAGAVGGHSAAVALARADDLLKDILGTALWSASDAELTNVLALVSQVKARLAAVDLAAVAEAHGRDIAKRDGAASTQAWLRHRLRVTPAEAKKRTALAVALDRDLDTTRRALAEGELSVGRAQVIARALEDLPEDVGRDVREAAEARLVEWSRWFDPAQLTRLGKRILHVVDPDAGDADEARRLAEEEKRAWQRREFTFTDDGHGTVWIRGRLPVADAAVFHHRLTHGGQWHVRMASDGRPEFIPPPLIDPQRRPLRNHLRRAPA